MVSSSGIAEGVPSAGCSALTDLRAELDCEAGKIALSFGPSEFSKCTRALHTKLD